MTHNVKIFEDGQRGGKMSTVIGSVMMLFFACVAMRAMTNYKLVSGERAKKNIINGYKLVIVLAFLGAILLFIDF